MSAFVHSIDEFYHQPFWGAPTCVDDSLEPNYIHTPYVGELICAITCIPWLLVGTEGIRTSKFENPSSLFARLPFISPSSQSSSPSLSPSVRLMYGLHFLAGLMGIIYHSTLFLWAQLLDRIVVLWWMISIYHNLYALLPADEKRKSPSLNTIYFFSLAVISTVLTIFKLHVPCFALLVLVNAYYGRKVSKHHPVINQLWSTGLKIAIPALISFLADRSLGVALEFFHFHSVWHVLALYSTSYFMAFVHAASLEQGTGFQRGKMGGGTYNVCIILGVPFVVCY